MKSAIIEGNTIYITDNVMGIFISNRVSGRNKAERGGILLGQVSTQENRILISRASLPTALDRGTQEMFERARDAAQHIVEYEFHNSGRLNTYMGEWHTHAARRATPSAVDIEMLETQFRSNEIRLEFLIMVIVARLELFLGYYDGSVLSHKIISY